MKQTRIVIIIMLLLTAIEIPLSSTSGLSAEMDAVEPVSQLVVYYFHGTNRCRTCRTIEEYTRQAVNNGFGDELEKGTMELRLVNVDLEENRHFIQDYQLFSRSVVLSLRQDGKETAWKRLDRVWELVRDESEFIDYIQNEIRRIRQAEHK